MNTLTRRDFLKVLGSTPLLVNSLTSQIWGSSSPHFLSNPQWDNILILIEMSGGNDGLNTVIPLDENRYYDYRKNIAIPENEIVSLSSEFGLHPSLDPLRDIWQDGSLAIIHGLGYDQPNHSHFRSIDIWHTGSDSDQVLATGWLYRSLLAETRPEELLADSVVLGNSQIGPLEGNDLNNLVITDLNSFLKRSQVIQPVAITGMNDPHQHIIKTQNQLHDSLIKMDQALNPLPVLKTNFPKTNLGQQAETLCLLLASGLKIPIFKLFQGGYDTHSEQAPTHSELLAEMAEALVSLRKGLEEINRWHQTLISTYSEFGRRVYENDSLGTDHGTAAPHLMTGGQVIGGFYGTPTSFDNLINGDFVHTSDYRRLYSTMLTKWLQISNEFLESYPPFDCLP